ncbi:WbqC family protein [Rhizobium sp. GCM10022189]|uniref:WbqC family protein n=1 Tax=Rhizobium sp. GCM10022189 TaxID=3252654 RepID=UPI000DDCB9FD
MKKVAIVQSNYLPWKGYFDMIASVDEFILYDEVQYTRRDWRNRNKFKTPQGLQWLTVPVKVKGRYLQTIKETEIDGDGWREAHWKSLAYNYGKAPYYHDVATLIEPILLHGKQTFLSDLNADLLKAVCSYLGITTYIRQASEFDLLEGKSERLLGVCLATGATTYVSGPAAQDYLDQSLFADAGVAVEWFDYRGYPIYPQLWGDFEHSVSILDLLFNCGHDSKLYMQHLNIGR